MNPKFETEEEAKKAHNEALAKGLGFCPLINNRCRTDCICYDSGGLSQFKNVQDEPWVVFGPFCTNPLINGEITVNS